MRTISLRRLNFHHLHYFWVVAKEGHLTRAARQLHVSQSALSAQIRQLEQQLGHALFVREGRSLRLTEMGSLVLGYAEGIFTLGSELLATVGGADASRVHALRVGAVATLSRNFQENFLRPLIGVPDVQLVLVSGSLAELLESLGVHRLDLVLSNRPVLAAGDRPWRCRRISRQKVCLVGPPRDGAAPFRFPRDAVNLRLVLPGPSSDIRSQFDVLCEEAGLLPAIAAEVDDMAMLRLIARDSGAVAVLPEVVVQDELRAGVLERYCELPRVFENFYAVTTRRQIQPAALTRLLQPR